MPAAIRIAVAEKSRKISHLSNAQHKAAGLARRLQKKRQTNNDNKDAIMANPNLFQTLTGKLVNGRR